MPKRQTKSADPITPPSEVSGGAWDLSGFLNTDIRKLEISKSLRQLGQIRVMDWDFRTVLPAVTKVANREVDLADLLSRTANFKIMNWDFRSPLGDPAAAQAALPTDHVVESAVAPETQALIGRLQNFLQYVMENLIDEPTHAQIRVTEIAPKVLRFKLVLVKKDVAMLIGREGFTATAIRTVMKAVAETQGVNVLLQIHSHEEEQAKIAKERSQK